jgi:hypothetical protein
MRRKKRNEQRDVRAIEEEQIRRQPRARRAEKRAQLDLGRPQLVGPGQEHEKTNVKQHAGVFTGGFFKFQILKR